MSYGILNPATGFQRQGMLSLAPQATGTPQRTTGSDLSQFAAQTMVPADAMAQPVTQSVPTAFAVPQRVMQNELRDQGYSGDTISHQMLLQSLMPAGGATESRREAFQASPLARFSPQERYSIYQQATRDGVEDNYNLNTILQALYG